MQLIDKKLACGARLLVLSPFNSELTALSLAFHVGFAHEERENLGISHMVEHLCFSDNSTKTFPEFRGAIEALGGSFNGYTQETMTVYTLELLSDHWEDGLGLLKDIAYQPKFTEEACQKEVKVLLAETGQLKQRWLAWFYEKGWFRNYGVLLRDQIWGNKMHNRKTFHRYASLQSNMLKEWHKKYYRPDNMTIVAVGNVDLEKLEKIIEKDFKETSDYSKVPLEHPKPTKGKKASRIISRVGEPFWNQSIVSLGSWNNGAVGEEKATSDIALSFLRNKAFDSLRLKHSLAYGVWSFFEGMRDGGYFFMGASVKKGNERKVEQLLKELLIETIENNIPEKDLSALRNMFLAMYARKNANPSWYAMEITRGAFGEYPIETEDYPTQIRKVTPEKIRQLLKRITEEKEAFTIYQIPLMSVPTTVCVIAGIILSMIGLIIWLVIK